MTTSDPNNSRAEAAAAKAYSRAQRPWVARHKILTALAAFVVLGVIVSATGGGSKKADTSASDPLTSSAPAAAAAPAETTAPVAAAPAADTGKPNDKGWVVQSLRTKDDGLGSRTRTTAARRGRSPSRCRRAARSSRPCRDLPAAPRQGRPCQSI
jgi:hypothetical protein